MKSFASLDWEELKSRYAASATSELAKDEIQNLSPLDSPEQALGCVTEILQTVEVLNLGRRPHMESLDLFSTWMTRLEKKAILRNLELKDLRHFCHETLVLKEVLASCSGNFLKASAEDLMSAEEPLSALDQILTPEGDVKSDASEKMYQLHEEKRQKTKELQNSLDRLVKDHELDSVLQERYVTTREGRWVLPVRSGMRHSLEGVIHASSQSRQTVYMEPQLVVPLNNRLRQIESEMEEEVERLLTELSHYLFSLNESFGESYKRLLKFDILLSLAQVSSQIEAHSFHFSGVEIDLRDLRHPLLSLNPDQVVSNNVHLTESERLLLLSGPNAGGKTVLMKAIGLAAQMARCGLPIAANPQSKLPFFHDITVAVGDQQSVEENLSTFAAHLKKLDAATMSKGYDQLVLIDEICGSTDPEEGSALARSFIESYLKNHCFAVITSHLGALKKSWEGASGLIHGSLEFDHRRGPTYQLLIGVPGQSLAIQTAKRVGVNDEIVSRAKELLSPEARRFQEEMDQIQKLKETLHSLQFEVQTEKKSLAKQQKLLDEKLQQFDAQKDQKLEKEIQRARKQIESEIQAAKAKDIFRKYEQADKLRDELPEIVKSPPSGSLKRIESSEDFAKAFPSGSKVFIAGLGQDAVVQGAPNAKGEVPILSRSMRMTVPWQQLRPPAQAQNPTREVLRKSGLFSSSPSEEDPVVDFRGQRVEEALHKLELELDSAILRGEDRIKLVHGHGTDSLKKALRQYLSRSHYVKKWQAGSAKTGGDGITWVELQGS